jgi:hypothetical protein
MLTSAYSIYWRLGGHPHATSPLRFTVPLQFVCIGLLDGMAVGRIVLGFATERCGERWSVVACVAFAIALEVVFQMVALIAISLVTMTFLRFFLGPISVWNSGLGEIATETLTCERCCHCRGCWSDRRSVLAVCCRYEEMKLS